ncbi:MAG: CAP domain-containing protein, partial [Solirubrobacteraceae bacterium]
RSHAPKAPSVAPTHPVHAKGAARAGTPTVTVNVGPKRPAPPTIASVLATPCQDTEAIPSTANLEAVEAATLCLVNQERARQDELPLSVNAQLGHAAQLHSQDMLQDDYFAHIAPSGETPFERVKASGYIPNSEVGYTVGENLAWGTLYLATPSSIVAAWIASPEHLANILTADYRDTAISVAPAAPASLAGGQAGATYTQEFGVIQG